MGAGPTGMILALWLHAQGVKVRIIEKNSSSATQSRALAVQARTLELYQQMNLTDKLLSEGYRAKGISFWSEGERQANFSMTNLYDS